MSAPRDRLAYDLAVHLDGETWADLSPAQQGVYLQRADLILAALPTNLGGNRPDHVERNLG